MGAGTGLSLILSRGSTGLCSGIARGLGCFGIINTGIIATAAAIRSWEYSHFHYSNKPPHNGNGGSNTPSNGGRSSVIKVPPITTSLTSPSKDGAGLTSSPGGRSGTNPPSTGGSGSPSPGMLYYTVVSGDTLWGVAARFYGTGLMWQRIYRANIGVIGSNPNLIYVGERLVIPR